MHSKHLVPINLELKKFELLYRELNGLILFRVSDLAWVYRYCIPIATQYLMAKCVVADGEKNRKPLCGLLKNLR